MDTKDRPLKEVVYTPDSDLLSIRKLLGSMVEDFRASHDLAWRLFVRNLKAQYRQSFIGYAWAFAPPIFISLVWIFLQSQQIIGIGDTGVPYAVFVVSGIVFWTTFVEALNSPLKMVNQSKPMLAKVNFPREALILAGMGQVVFNFIVRSTLLVVLVWYFNIELSSSMWLIPLGVVSLIFLGLSLGLIITPFGVLYADVGRSLGFAAQALFFLTPVIYPVPRASFASTLIQLNPVTPLLDSTRNWLLGNPSESLWAFSFVLLSSFIVLFLGWCFYRITMPHLISRMSA